MPVPDFLLETCFEWTVEAHCKLGSSLSDPACYAIEFYQEGPKERSGAIQSSLGEAVISTEVFPNPARGAVTFSVQMKQASSLRVEVLNNNGQLVSQMNFGDVEPGLFQRTWQPDLALESGAYLVKFIAGTTIKTEKIVILK